MLRNGGVCQNINHHLVMLDRERAGREANSTAAVIDGRSAKTTEASGMRGYDAGKKVLGRKRHAMVDTEGRLLVAGIHAANVQDRGGTVPLLKASRHGFPFVEHAIAGSAYASDCMRRATIIAIEMIRKPAWMVGFYVHRRRWSGRVMLRLTWPRSTLGHRSSRLPSPPQPHFSTQPPSCSS